MERPEHVEHVEHVERTEHVARTERAAADRSVASPAEPSPAEPSSAEPSLAGLQRGIGNAATLALLARAQPMRTVGAAHDPAELEAGRVAAQVVAALGDGARPRTSRPAAGERDEPLRRAPIGPGGGALDAEQEASLAAATAGGAPLPEPTRTAMEGAFGADFSAVRVHADEGSARLAGSLSARAFTLGGHIFLGAGERTSDHRLLAHELTHTLQQGS